MVTGWEVGVEGYIIFGVKNLGVIFVFGCITLRTFLQIKTSTKKINICFDIILHQQNIMQNVHSIDVKIGRFKDTTLKRS